MNKKLLQLLSKQQQNPNTSNIMKEQLYILFCESPFQNNKVDEDFEDQFISAKENGFETLLFNFEELTSADRFSLATKRTVSKHCL